MQRLFLAALILCAAVALLIGSAAGASAQEGGDTATAAATPSVEPLVVDGPPSFAAVFAYNDRNVPPGSVDVADLVILVFSETMSDDATADGNGVTVRDDDGTTGQIACGAGVDCAFVEDPELQGVSMTLNQGIAMLLDTAADLRAEGGSVPGLQYPLTIAGATGALTDTTGDAIDVTASADLEIDNDEANFERGVESPGDSDNGFPDWAIILVAVLGVAVIGGGAIGLMRMKPPA